MFLPQYERPGFTPRTEEAKLYFGKFGLYIFTQQTWILTNPFRLLIHELSCNLSHRRLHKVTQQNVFILVIFVDCTF